MSAARSTAPVFVTLPAPTVRVAPPAPPVAKARTKKAPKGAPEVTIDLMAPNARKALLAVFPSVLRADVFEAATEDTDRAARAYLSARDQAKILELAKERNGNILCAEIGLSEGLEGETWRARWSDRKGDVDWSALAKDLGIPDATIERYRRPSSRTLTVTAKGEA